MCFAVGSSLSMKRMTTAMPNYIAFLSLLHPIVLGLLFAAVALWRRVTGAVTDEMMRFPKFKFAVMGLWDSLACVLMMFGGKPPPAHTHTHRAHPPYTSYSHTPCTRTILIPFTPLRPCLLLLYSHYAGVKTPGAVQQLLNQACTPLTMVASVGLLKKRYHLMQWAGAAAIMAGVYVVMAPRLTKGLNAGEDGTEAGDQVGLCEALDLILRLIGVRSYFHVDHTELPPQPPVFFSCSYTCVINLCRIRHILVYLVFRP